MAVDYARRSLKIIEAGIALSSSEGLSKTSEQEGLLRLKGAVLDTLGWAYVKAGDLDAAEKALLDSLNTGAYEIVAMDHFAQVYEKKGRAADAVQYYVKAIARHFSRPSCFASDVLLLLGSLLWRQQTRSDASIYRNPFDCIVALPSYLKGRRWQS